MDKKCGSNEEGVTTGVYV